MKTTTRLITMVPIVLAVIVGCSSVEPRGVSDETNLNYCVTNPELITTEEAGVRRAPLRIRYCNYIPSGGSEKVILVQVGDQSYVYRDALRLGGKVYAEYRFRQNGDLLLMAYGFDNPDDDGNFFDYQVYEIGEPRAIKSGKSENRPRLLDVL